jgi:hypothetical protein
MRTNSEDYIDHTTTHRGGSRMSQHTHWDYWVNVCISIPARDWDLFSRYRVQTGPTATGPPRQKVQKPPFRAEGVQSVKLTIHRHVVQRLRTRGRIAPLPQTSSIIKEYFPPTTEYSKWWNPFKIPLPEKVFKQSEVRKQVCSAFQRLQI